MATRKHASQPGSVPGAGETREAGLSDTAHAILGLLTLGPRSGYDLLKLVESSIGFFWTPARSQIYSELKRLSALGLVSEKRVEQQDRPSKRVYSLTPDGRAVLRRWVEATSFEPDYIRSQFLLKLFFGRLASRETLLALIRKQREDAAQRASQLREMEERIKDLDEWLYPYLTLRYGLSRAEATVRWADEVMHLLEEEGR